MSPLNRHTHNVILNPESWQRSNIFNYSYNQRQRSFPNRELPWLFTRWNKIFQSYPTNERKNFHHKVIDQIDRYKFNIFNFDTTSTNDTLV